jgi:glycosyltransferase involved in cell wall biosynthesis
MIEVSVILPCFNEEKYIEKCLNSVIDSDFPKENMEILIIDGNSTDKTIEIIKKTYLPNHKWIKLLNNPDRIVPKAMNIGISNASGNFIIRIDAHSSYNKDYFSKLIKWSKELDADNVGGICKTEILNSNKKSNSIKTVLSNKFGVGNSDFRIGTDKIKEVDTVPFGCYKKEIFEKHGPYNEKLIRNQDIELNKRILKNGGKIYLLPDVECTYYAREEFLPLAKNNFKNGEWNILTVFYTKDFNSISLRHFVPLFFVLSLTIPLLFSILWWPLGILSAMSLLIYTLAVGLISIKENNQYTNLLYLIWGFFTLHLSYGFGSLIGIIKLPFIALQNK